MTATARLYGKSALEMDVKLYKWLVLVYGTRLCQLIIAFKKQAHPGKMWPCRLAFASLTLPSREWPRAVLGYRMKPNIRLTILWREVLPKRRPVSVWCPLKMEHFGFLGIRISLKDIYMFGLFYIAIVDALQSRKRF